MLRRAIPWRLKLPFVALGQAIFSARIVGRDGANESRPLRRHMREIFSTYGVTALVEGYPYSGLRRH